MSARGPASGLVDRAFWRGRRVLITGHTGFIGGWTAASLSALGSEVTGLALPPPTVPSFHDLVGLDRHVKGIVGDIRSQAAVAGAFDAAKPDVVLHLAAQPLVRVGYERPDETFAVNVAGTLNVLDGARKHAPQAVVVMTSDKVYGAGDGRTAHQEGDPLAARDPYGASKACADLAVQSYGASFFAPAGIGAATIRAGNVIGGGDWQVDRLVPDAVRAFGAGGPLVLRHPTAVRPWQHVLDAVRALLLAAEAAARAKGLVGPWNVGPAPEQSATVATVAGRVAEAWGDGAAVVHEESNAYPETPFLAIDGSRAAHELGLSAPWDLPAAIAHTVAWYKHALARRNAWEMTMEQIAAYEAACTQRIAADVSA